MQREIRTGQDEGRAREDLTAHVLELQGAMISLQRQVYQLTTRVDELELELEQIDIGAGPEISTLD